ncbi:MAG: 3-isopropylmalate dehydratase small subunit [Anaerolineales bacterium]|jgi:3-isopropylmalate/(R)-2-methylmalate dehydratase small subunit|nr:3-isopropylmalate dehydratase small subunit [Anaerolineales bacterium]
MASFDHLDSTVYVLLVDNIDTDQIIPARFLKATDKNGMGAALFADWRYNADGSPKPDFALNRPERQGAQVLLAGDNFGCGSSREHAPWALTGFGLRAVIATSFADIFRNNALKNGLLPVQVDAETHRALAEQVSADPQMRVAIDLAAQTLRLPDGQTAHFPIEPFAKTCLLQGVDELGYIQSFAAEIEAFENRIDICDPPG